MYRALLTVSVSAFFTLFGGGSALVIGLIYPFRAVIAVVIRVWAWGVLRAAGVRLTIEGAHHIADGRHCVFMGNHQSGLDIPIVIYALRGHVRFMAKKSLFYVPVFGWVLLRYGFVPIDRSNPRVALGRLDRMIQRIRRDPISFVVFPEGTRSRDGKLLPFRRGTMKIGQRMGLPIIPFSIDGSIDVHHRDHFRAVPGPVRLTFLEPIPADQVAAMSPGELLNRVLLAVKRGLASDAVDAASAEAPLVPEGA